MLVVRGWNNPPSLLVLADVQGSCATSGEGLYEGLEWLEAIITKKEVKKAVVNPIKEVVSSVSPDSQS